MPRAKKPAIAPIPVAEPVAQVPPPIPVGPSPAVLELQGDIVAFVRARSEYRKLVAEKQAALFAAQSEFQATQGRLNQFEQEISERIDLIARLENRAPQPRMAHVSEISDYQSSNFPIGNLAEISVEPTQPTVAGYQSDPNDRVNRGHAVRAAL